MHVYLHCKLYTCIYMYIHLYVIDKSYLTSGYRRYTRRFVVNYEGVARVIYPNRRVYLR